MQIALVNQPWSVSPPDDSADSIALVTHQLGHQQPLGAAEVEKLVVVRAKYRGGMEPADGNHHKKASAEVDSALDMVTQRRSMR